MKKIICALGIAVIFVSGLVIGAVGMQLYIRERVKEVFKGGPTALREAITAEMAEDLKLTPDQTPKVAEIVARTHDKILALRMANQDEIQGYVDEGIAEIKTHLTASQRTEIEEMVSRAREIWGRDAPQK